MYHVVVRKTDLPSARYAAEELRFFLEQVTGNRIGLSQQRHRKARNFLVGNMAAASVAPDFSTESLGRDGILLRSVGEDIILAGGEPRGVLYSVYTFLEDYAGCRWWTEKDSSILRRPDFEAPRNLDVRYTPPFEYRFPFYAEAFDTDWAVRNKSNGPAGLAADKYGGYMSDGGVHTFYRLIPPERYFEKHPDWFSLINGRRTCDRAQLCLSNPEMREELVRNLKAHIREHPMPPVYSVSQNDCYGWCECGACSELAGRYGGQSGLMVWFVNQVAEAIEHEFPDVALSTLAYLYTRQPPRNITPRRNVIILLCSIECSFSVPLDHERNARFRDDMRNWAAIADRLYVWDYVTNFSHHVMPHPNLRVLDENVRFFAANNVRGVFELGAYTTRCSEFAHLRSWVLAKLLWNPSLSGRKLVEEFCRGYYGKAGEWVLKYIDAIHDAVAATGDYLGCYSPATASFLSFDVLSRAIEYLRAAADAAAGDALLLQRVKEAQLPVKYVFLVRWEELRSEAERKGCAWPLKEDFESECRSFIEEAQCAGITRLDEWNEGFGVLELARNRIMQVNPVPIGKNGVKQATASHNAWELPVLFDEKAFHNTPWNARSHAPAWFQFEFDEPRKVKMLVLTAAQAPDGETRHEVFALLPDGTERLVAEIEGVTRNGEVLKVDFPGSLKEVSGVRVLTQKSPSWVAWLRVKIE